MTLKKILGILLAMLLIVSLSVSAFAVTDTEEDIWKATQSGFEMPIPDAYRDAKGYITFKDLGEGVNPGSGVVRVYAYYVAMPADKYKALMDEQTDAYMSGDIEKLNETIEQTVSVEWGLFTVYGINRDRGENELRSILMDELNLSPEGLGRDEELTALITALYKNIKYLELGEKDGLRYYLSYSDPEDAVKFLELQEITEPDPVYLDEYKSILAQLDQLGDKVTLTGSAVLADAAEVGARIDFETTDLEGNLVSSEDIFQGHRITMINMWATWCDPCKDELPELAKMAETYEKQGCQIIGICLDAEDEETMAEGRAILKEAGVNYLNIAPFEGREEQLPNKLYPTTYFVDENGVILDEVIIGAMVTRYPQAMNKLLAGLAAEEQLQAEAAKHPAKTPGDYTVKGKK